MTEHRIRIPTHVDAAYRVAATLAEPVANRRRIRLELTLKTDPAGTGTIIGEAITAIPTRLTLERSPELGDGWVLVTYDVTLEAGEDLTEAITKARLDAPPNARTDPVSGALRTLELELLLAEGTTDPGRGDPLYKLGDGGRSAVTRPGP